jgi:hypothetical protein
LTEVVAFGVKARLMLVLAPAARAMGRDGAETIVNCDALTAMLLMEAELPPVLVTVTVCVGLATFRTSLLKVNEPGLTARAAAVTPAPATATLLGEYWPLLTTETHPLTEPEAAGLKMMLAVELWFGVKVTGRVGAVTTKLLLSELIALTVAFTVPVLVTVRVCAAEAAPMV